MRTAVLVCDHLPAAEGLCCDLAAGLAEVVAQVVPRLCRQPRQMAAPLRAAAPQRLVLGLCAPVQDVAEMQAQARAAGLDALGVEVVLLEGAGARAPLLLAAAVARARAFAGSTPAQAKLYLSAQLSRRSLLRLSLPVYGAAPSIDPERCAAEAGCQACVQVCPQGALAWEDGRVRYDKARCEPCGLCVTACPRGAITNPAATPAQLEAQVRTLLDPARGTLWPRGLVFTCQQAPPALAAWHPGWLPVALPCVAMAPPAWLLAPLLLGAGAVGVLPCAEGCRRGQEERIAARVAYSQAFLQALGAPAERVSLCAALDRPPPAGEAPLPLVAPFAAGATARVLAALAARYGAPADLVLEHAASPLGVIEVRQAACTGCGRCALSCPTGALVFAQQAQGVTLSFDATLCVACGQCLPRCPEAGAIALRRRTDLGRLAQGRQVVYREATARCQACGAAIAPQAMLRRLAALLGPELAATAALLGKYCPDCRPLASPAGLHRSGEKA
ncbi:MAG: hypothetical protein KatS3mg131_1384 [Candidatus Tectimicrobiota bacterium]|nr:MAG: hypothetical protein KatS3mg131_1384 [Candidatus Tectomicrobia bacterium]